MNTLVLYATKHGTTRNCASLLSKKLAGKVDLYDLKAGKIPDLSRYDKVIIGGSIYAGRIQKEVSQFCSQNLHELKVKKLGLFICCMFPNQAEAQLNTSFPQELLNSAAARDSFGGEMKFSTMGFAEKAITRMVSKVIAKGNADLPALDMKKDISMISEEAIHTFAQRMNNA